MRQNVNRKYCWGTYLTDGHAGTRLKYKLVELIYSRTTWVIYHLSHDYLFPENFYTLRDVTTIPINCPLGFRRSEPNISQGFVVFFSFVRPEPFTAFLLKMKTKRKLIKMGSQRSISDWHRRDSVLCCSTFVICGMLYVCMLSVLQMESVKLAKPCYTVFTNNSDFEKNGTRLFDVRT